MKDLVQIWKRVTGKQYPNSDKEMKEMPNNRLKRGDVDNLTYEANFSECEGLNSKYEELEFRDRKDAIINRLFERRKNGHVGRYPKGEFLNVKSFSFIYSFLCIINQNLLQITSFFALKG